jgi:hypothetical protein
MKKEEGPHFHINIVFFDTYLFFGPMTFAIGARPSEI